ncbi:MAG: bacteriochlorophyll synthase, partial [Dehalococcoidia bacterium]|nr:bacteriochlorophyll synthase [Dehalococcoidia bacterium]
LLVSAGAHGIMTINDFKSIHGDRLMGIKSIPVQVGPHYAAFLAVFTISLAQLFAVMILGVQGMPISALLVLLVLVAQTPIAYRFIREPEKYAVFYNSAVGLYVLGMLVAAYSSR